MSVTGCGARPKEPHPTPLNRGSGPRLQNVGKGGKQKLVLIVEMPKTGSAEAEGKSQIQKPPLRRKCMALGSVFPLTEPYVSA